MVIVNDPHREAPIGLHIPTATERQPFDHRGWVLLVFLVSIALGIVVGWWQDDWDMGAAIAGSNYVVGLLTIIALKD